MEKLNSEQMGQIEELESVTSKKYAQLMLKYTKFISSEQLDNLYSFHEAAELEKSGDFVHISYDANFYSVASEYCELNKNTILQPFGWYGEYNLYMDEYGRGLVVWYY